MNGPASLNAPAPPSIYYPGRGDDWERRRPEAVGMDPQRLEEAIAYANSHETAMPRDILADLRVRHGSRRYDDGAILGPTRPRTGVNGLVLRHGYIVAEWGDTRRADMTFSITKSYLSTLAGIAVDRGMIRDVHDRVGASVDDGGFDSDHNARITWHHLFQQTSEWDGTLWAKHYSAGNQQDQLREPAEPGTVFEYNDVRVNRCALALLRVWRRPLPQVLRTEVMDPIGASNTWEWHGYDNAWVTIDGLQVQSVSGGGHWGGGLWIGSRDHARFGYLFLRRGLWRDRRIVSERWVALATTPGDVNPVYGYMWWLNTGRRQVPSAPESSFYASGVGANRIWVDPEHDLVVVVRWMEAAAHFDGVAALVLAALHREV